MNNPDIDGAIKALKHFTPNVLSPSDIFAMSTELTPFQRRMVTDAFDVGWAIGPRVVACNMDCSVSQAKSELKALRAKGICDYGPAFTNDGYLAGRGYWLDSFGSAVAQRLTEMNEAQS